MAGVRDPAGSDTFQSATRKTHALGANSALTTWYTRENEIASPIRSDFDLTISAGLSKEGYFCGINIYGPSILSTDILRRAAFFQEVVSELGLSNKILVRMDDGILRMLAQKPWILWFPSAKPDGGDPGGFHARGFTNIESALSAAERVLKRFARETLGVSFSAKLPGEGYKAVFGELNVLWHPWDMEVLGSLTADAIEILNGGEMLNTSPSRIPAFEWYGAQGWAAYGSVVIENGQRYLEIASEGATLKQLEKRVEFLDDLEFEPT